MDLDAIFSEMESRSTPDDSVLCVIDDNLRIVTVPSSGMVFGVEKDKDVNKIDFEMDRYYRDNDMSEFSARIYYQNAKGNKNYSTVTDLSFTEDKITFSWTVPAYALMYEGTIRFAVNFIKTSGSVVEKAFNTTIASANCLIGLYIDTQIPEKEFEDYLTHLKNEIKGYSDVQLAAIEDATTEALTGIDDAEEEALSNIKQALPAITDSDFGKAVTVKSDASGVELSGPYAPIEVAVRPTVSGNPVVAEDSIAWNFQGLKIYGKSTQDGTPSPENPVSIISAGDDGELQILFTAANIDANQIIGKKYATATGSVTANVEDDGIHINGTSDGAYRALYRSTLDYLISTKDVKIFVSSSESNGVYLQLEITKHDGSKNYVYGGKAYTTLGTEKNFQILFQTGNKVTTFSDLVVKDYISLYGELGQWVPYQSQTLTLSTPNGLPGIPVDSGGTFVDADGQQWICNEIDLKRGVLIQRTKTFSDLTFSILQGGVTEYSNLYESKATIGILKSGYPFAFCSNLQYKNGLISSNETGFYVYGGSIRVRFANSKNETEDIETIKSYTFLTLLETPIEIPLSAEELAAYKALTTYDGTTVVSTAEPVAGIEVSYVADTQKYIDKKIEEAVSKISASQQGEEVNVSL